MAYSFFDGHEISDRFEFSVGKKTNGVDTSPILRNT